MWRTSENVPVSFVSKVDFPTEGNPDILAGNALRRRRMSWSYRRGQSLHLRPSAHRILSSQAVSPVHRVSCFNAFTFTFPTSTSTRRRLDQFTAQFRKLCLRTSTREVTLSHTRSPSTFSSPKCPAVALFFCVRAIYIERSVTAL